MEVKVINKQKFLAELGRLLTFMYEEDRQAALAMYSKMFDDAAEEQLLLQFLVSPTRQAVVLARSYDAKERKLQVHTQSRELEEDPDGEIPPFVLAINDLQQDAAARGIFSPLEDSPIVDENQFSLFDTLPIDEATPAEPFQPEPVPVEPRQDRYPENEASTQPLSPQEAETENTSVSEFADAVDAFLADFSIADGELVPKAAEEEAPLVFEEEDTVPQEEDEDKGQEGIILPEPAPLAEEEPAGEPEPVSVSTIRKANVPLLILFCLLGIPLTLLGILLLLVPALLCLCLAVAMVSMGVLVLTAAFGGFAIFADLMVVLGLAIILLAIGLLFTWLFIWFIGGAIVGLIRAVCQLGGRWCYKEVAAQ